MAHHRDVNRLDQLAVADTAVTADVGRLNAAWETAREAATSLESRGLTARMSYSRLRRLAAPTAPPPEPLLGVSMARLRQMGACPAPPTFPGSKAVATTVANLGDAAFDRLQREAEQCIAGEAVVWVLKLLAETSSRTEAVITGWSAKVRPYAV